MKTRGLNICIVTRITSDHDFGGMQHYVDLLAEGFVKRGNKVYIITTALKDGSVFMKTESDITTYFLENTRPGSYRRGFFKKAYLKYREIDAENHIDIIHGQSASALAFCGGKVSVPVVTSLFGVGYCETPYTKLIFPKLSLVQKLKFLLKLPKIAVSMRYMYKAAFMSDKVIVISRFSERELIRIKPELPKSRIKLIHCGIEYENFDLANKKLLKKQLGIKGNMILSAGRIEVQKGVHTLLEAWSKLNLQDTELIVVGDGSYLKKLRKIARKRRLKNCRFLGSVPRKVFSDYFAAADLFVYPELTKPAFGLVAAQALAKGTPVIGSDHGAIPEVIGDAGFLFNPSDSDDLAEKIEYFFDNRESWEYLGQKAQNRVESLFSVSLMLKETLGLYFDLIKKKRRSV